MNRKIVLAGLFLIVTGIVLGAFAAHALKELISAEKLASFEVGVRYQLYHGLALLVVGINADKLHISLRWFFALVLVGVLLFSFSIYLLSLSEAWGMNVKFLGPLTPLGGLLMVTAWVTIIVRLYNDRQT